MGVKSDIEIAQEAQMLDIREVAAKVGVAEDDLELYGKYKAKISDNLYSKLQDKKDGCKEWPIEGEALFSYKGEPLPFATNIRITGM